MKKDIEGIVMISEDQQVTSTVKLRPKRQLTLETNVAELYNLKSEDIIIYKVIGYKKAPQSDSENK